MVSFQQSKCTVSATAKGVKHQEFDFAVIDGAAGRSDSARGRSLKPGAEGGKKLFETVKRNHGW